MLRAKGSAGGTCREPLASQRWIGTQYVLSEWYSPASAVITYSPASAVIAYGRPGWYWAVACPGSIDAQGVAPTEHAARRNVMRHVRRLLSRK